MSGKDETARRIFRSVFCNPFFSLFVPVDWKNGTEGLQNRLNLNTRRKSVSIVRLNVRGEESMDDENTIEMQGICKSFYGIKALENVSLTLKRGEVMALLGENGAGKSTLMKILAGIVPRDAGVMRLFGNDVDGSYSPKKAQDLGIAIIHQELNMCRHLTVAENIFLGREVCSGSLLNNRRMNELTQAVLDSLKIEGIEPDTVVGDLTVAKQQMVEIAKAVQTNSRILIMDEPTSALANKATEKLFETIHNLKRRGVGIIYISHRLEELQYVADRVTILRNGKFVKECAFRDISMDDIIKNMVGKEISEQFPHVTMARGEKVFSVTRLNAGKDVRNISFDAYKGEILGIAGLTGAGRTETARAIFGIRRKCSGTIELDGKEVKIKNPHDAIKHGLALAPEDRKKDGLCTKLSVKDNLCLPNLDKVCNKLGWISRKKENALLAAAVENLAIKLADGDVNADALSGGNQQKLVVAKWFARENKVVIFDEPTRGIDVGAKIEIYNLMNKLKFEGKGVIFISSELPEVLGIADRILVMCDGRITGELLAKDATQEKIMYYATRFEDKKTKSMEVC